MLSNITKLLLGAIIAVGVFGCSQNNMIYQKSETQLEKNWGRSFETARHNQILNPEAGKQTEPVVGMDGPAAERIMENYIKGEASKPKSSPEFDVVSIKR